MNRPLQPTAPASAAESERAAAHSGSLPRDPDEELRRLKRLLLTSEQEQISNLQRRLDDPEVRAEEASRVLAEAVRRAAAGDPELAVALRPLVESGLQESVRRNPAVIVETIYPILGPAIRKAVASAVRGMVESLNRVVEHSFTWRGLRWRMEAWRTGQTVAEVALRHSIVYRVEQALLIHRETGLLLLAVGADPAARDKDLVSGMLTAIQDFVHDSFSVERDQDLDRLEVGDFQVWIERGPRAALAAVIRGSAPRRLRGALSDAIAGIHRDMRARLESFDGDAAPFEAARPALEDCLEQEFREKRKGPSPVLLTAAGVLAAVLAAWGFFAWRNGQRWSRFEEAVRSAPGLVFVNRAGDAASLLRDPLAADPAGLAQEAGFDAGSPALEIQPFLSFDAPIVERRVRATLTAPDSVQFAYAGGALTVSGQAPAGWIEKLRLQGPTLPGVERLVTDALSPSIGALETATREIAALHVAFAPGATEIEAGQLAVVDALADKLGEAIVLAKDSGRSLRIEVVGRADEAGPLNLNLRLSEQRARELQRLLAERGLPARTYSERGEAGHERTASVEIRIEETAP